MKSLIAAIATFGLVVSTHAQSLAEAAKKAEEARAKAKQEQSKTNGAKDADTTEKSAAAKKVFTNKDLADVPAPAATAPAPAKKSESDAATTAGSIAKSDVKDEAYWR